MEFDWTNEVISLNDGPTHREVEESFEDPHGVRLIPDSPRFSSESRAFCLGKTTAGKGIFSVYRSDGKRIRIVGARHMTPEEEYFYERQVARWNQ